jgi:retron-type reverse transcriptase
MKIILHHKFEEIINIENLLQAYKEFVKGKKNRMDVLEFSFMLMDNLIELRDDLANHTYKHQDYQEFKINDPKPRVIHKAVVRDRILHRAVYRILYPFFDKKFIVDSYSCRNKKGTHRAIKRFEEFAQKVSKNNTKQCYILKCDIKKFFASVDQDILLQILGKHINDKNTLDLLKEIIFSFKLGGLPLGNLTSQLFANIYLNEFDQFIKHKLKEKYYIRYADDFVIFSQDKNHLENLIPPIKDFFKNVLDLTLHKDKVFIEKLKSGVDFLGWLNFFDYRILRKGTKKRMLRNLKENYKLETVNSYLGLLKHGNAYKITEILKNYL